MGATTTQGTGPGDSHKRITYLSRDLPRDKFTKTTSNAQDLITGAPSSGGGGGTVDQGTPGPCDAPWPVVLTEDGTDACVKVADDANKAVRVNIVAGGGSSGGATPFEFETTLTVTTGSAYAVGNQVGALMTFTNAAATDNGLVLIQSIAITDLDNLSQTYDFLLFSENPAGSTLADKTIPVFTAADWANVEGAWTFFGAETISVGSRGVNNKFSIATLLQTTGGQRNLYGLLITRGTPTYVTASALTFRLKGYAY